MITAFAALMLAGLTILGWNYYVRDPDGNLVKISNTKSTKQNKEERNITMKHPLLRISYWAGAIMDGVAALAMIFPAFGKRMFGLTDFTPGPDYTFAMGMGASLMLGWTALLIWADRDPLARKGILLITVFPVIFGIVIAEIMVVTSGLIAVEWMIPLWIMQVSLSILFIFSYWRSR